MLKFKLLSITTCFILFAVHLSASSPLPNVANFKLDQRQEGDWNVRADLENFLVLIVPTNVNLGMASLALLDLFKKSPNNRKPMKKQPEQEKLIQDQTVEQDKSVVETEHFIESKTAPYQVDISKTRSNLAKLHPDGDNLLISAHSPTIAITKGNDILSRMSRAYVITIPVNRNINKKNKEEELTEGENWRLLGDGIENCGPGLTRDSKGICKSTTK